MPACRRRLGIARAVSARRGRPDGCARRDRRRHDPRIPPLVSISLVALAVIVLVVDVLTAPARGKGNADAESPRPGPASPEVGRRWSGRTDAQRTDAVRPSPDGLSEAKGPP
jgi:hypothetical protein